MYLISWLTSFLTTPIFSTKNIGYYKVKNNQDQNNKNNNNILLKESSINTYKVYDKKCLLLLNKINKLIKSINIHEIYAQYNIKNIDINNNTYNRTTLQNAINYNIDNLLNTNNITCFNVNYIVKKINNEYANFHVNFDLNKILNKNIKISFLLSDHNIVSHYIDSNQNLDTINYQILEFFKTFDNDKIKSISIINDHDRIIINTKKITDIIKIKFSLNNSKLCMNINFISNNDIFKNLINIYIIKNYYFLDYNNIQHIQKNMSNIVFSQCLFMISPDILMCNKFYNNGKNIINKFACFINNILFKTKSLLLFIISCILSSNFFIKICLFIYCILSLIILYVFTYILFFPRQYFIIKSLIIYFLSMLFSIFTLTCVIQCFMHLSIIKAFFSMILNSNIINIFINGISFFIFYKCNNKYNNNNINQSYMIIYSIITCVFMLMIVRYFIFFANICYIILHSLILYCDNSP